MAKLKTVTRNGNRLEQLKVLANVLATGIDDCDDPRSLPQLTKQYRETIKEIEEIQGGTDDGDEISEILAGRQADGKPGTVRKNRA